MSLKPGSGYDLTRSKLRLKTGFLQEKFFKILKKMGLNISKILIFKATLFSNLKFDHVLN